MEGSGASNIVSHRLAGPFVVPSASLSSSGGMHLLDPFSAEIPQRSARRERRQFSGLARCRLGSVRAGADWPPLITGAMTTTSILMSRVGRMRVEWE